MIDRVLAALERVFGTFSPDHGNSEEELAHAEQRLKVRLPESLRALYLRTGHHPMHRACHVLIQPSALSFDRAHLVFYREQQDACSWGIEQAAMVHGDPPVSTGIGAQFVVEFASVSEFVAVQAAQQAVEGALPFVGVILPAQPVGGVLSSPKTSVSLERFARSGDLLTRSNSVEVRVRPGSIALAQRGGYLGLAAHSADLFASQAECLGVRLSDWDYATLRDEL